MNTVLQPLTFLAALLSFSIAVWTARYLRRNIRARLYFFLVACIFIYSFGYSQEIIQTSLSGILFWLKFEYIGVPFIPGLLALVALHCTHYRESQNFHPLAYVILAPGLLVLISNWAYPYLDLFYKEVTILQSNGGINAGLVPGPVYYFHVLENVIAIMVALVLYTRASLLSSRYERGPYLSMVFGTAIPGVTYILYVLSVFPAGVDPIPISMALVSPFLAYGVFSRQLLNDLARARSIYYKHSPHPVFVFNKEERLIDMNQSARNVFDLERRRTLNKTWPQVSKILDISDLTEVQEVENGNRELVYKDRIFNMSTHGFFGPLGNFRGELKILYDITRIKTAMNELARANISARNELEERRRLDRSLEQAKNTAEEASRAKGEFLTNMSHEIRTPLNGIIGMTDLLSETRLNHDQTIYFNTIQTEARALNALINDILDVAKIEAGKLEIAHLPFDLSMLFNEFVSSFSLMAKQKKIKFTAHLSPEIPSNLKGDAVRLRQILVNLTGNALKFTPEGGTISLRAVPGKDSGENRAGVRFDVRDSGIGIPEEKQKKIFESFAQADGSTTREYGGTGLGITISKQLSQLMGGEMGLESREGEGSLFWFTVVCDVQASDPVGDPDRKSLPALPEPGPLTRPFRILVAEDYPTNQRVAMAFLTKAGFSAELTENGEQAVAAFQKQRYDLILMDIQMPVMDGFQATEAIRRLEAESGATSRIPIVALTAHATVKDREDCFTAGMDDYITKPIKRVELLEKIRQWQDGAALSVIQERGGPDPKTVSPFDFNQAVEDFDGMREEVIELVQEFSQVADRQIESMTQALETWDMETIAREAHALKGGAANLYAIPLSSAAACLETAAGNRERDKISQALAGLIKEKKEMISWFQKNIGF